MYPQVPAPFPTSNGSDALIRTRDDKLLSMHVKGSNCWFRWLICGIVFILGSIVCVVFIILKGTNLYDAASRCLIFGIISFIIGLSTKYMVLEGDDEKLEVTFGPCSAYQSCLCCTCNRALVRGQLRYSHIRHVHITQGDCRDGFGISKRKRDSSCVHTVICCPEHVVEVYQEGGPTGCCRAGQKIRYAVATHEQAVELQTFLTSQATLTNGALASSSGTINGPVTTPIATAPPKYDAVTVSPAYTLPPATSFE